MIALALLGAAAACQSSHGNAGPIERSAAGLQQVPLTVRSGSRTHKFIVEVAGTPQEQATGLMNRMSLAPDRGMIFPFPTPRQASFWMRNTFIPLDIIFIRSDGTIANIAENTIPFSEDQILSEGPVSTVLELAGGRAAELGIKAGDRVEWAQ
ncbi:DUF192 domain-containing protein [Sphingomonas xanthus]|uniref:DUF192 domain-containing protein n=1 Tax=Sphingomonas xanthus TaxID=2594473 RepID=A0A516IQ30_9SPHN|nr:DUF192 domain-containing protein [Sphingomonas xanthus]QDP18979.1 DUF192 domain-containing protein [Sphingomonas xanthus]